MRNNRHSIPEKEWDRRKKQIEDLLARHPEAPTHVMPYVGSDSYGDGNSVELFVQKEQEVPFRNLLLNWADFHCSPQALYKTDSHTYTSYLIPREDLTNEEWDAFWETLQRVLPEAENWDKDEIDEVDIGIPSSALPTKEPSEQETWKEPSEQEIQAQKEKQKQERKEKRGILLTKILVFTIVPLFWAAVFALVIWLIPGEVFPERPVSYDTFKRSVQVQEDTRTIGVDIFLRQTVYTGTREHPEVSYYRYKLDTHCDYYQLETSYKSKELLPFVTGTVKDEKATSLETKVTEQTITYEGQVYEKDFYYEVPMLELTVPEKTSLSDWKDAQMKDAYQAYRKALKQKDK